MDWNVFTKTIDEWKKTNKGWDDMKSPNFEEDLLSLNNMLAKGDDESRQKRAMRTIRMFFDDVESTPFRRTGKASTIDIAILSTYNAERALMKEVLATSWEDNTFLQNYAVKSKRGGGGVFTSGLEYAEYELSSFDTRVKAAMRGSSKDYSFTSGQSLKNLIPQKEA
tara:strand:+ start:651 stop:1151 length:501 start_codon:yes stop_codon:yes gene_type:complete